MFLQVLSNPPDVKIISGKKKKKISRAVKRRVLTQTIWWNDGGKQAQTELGREEEEGWKGRQLREEKRSRDLERGDGVR